jgi:hypothetical protein
VRFSRGCGIWECFFDGEFVVDCGELVVACVVIKNAPRLWIYFVGRRMSGASPDSKGTSDGKSRRGMGGKVRAIGVSKVLRDPSLRSG